jgi:hypothetical protein
MAEGRNGQGRPGRHRLEPRQGLAAPDLEDGEEGRGEQDREGEDDEAAPRPAPGANRFGHRP